MPDDLFGDAPNTLREGELAIAVQPLTGLRRVLGYRVPAAMAGKVAVGSLVRVPILRRTELAIVRELEAPGDYPLEKLKYILECVHDYPALTPELIPLADWMCRYYAASPEAVFEAMLPAAVRRGMKAKQERLIAIARKIDAPALEKLRKRAPKQAKLYEFLIRQMKPLERSLVLGRLEIGPSSCDSMVEKGIIAETAARVHRGSYEEDFDSVERVAQTEHALTDEQQAAVDSLTTALDSGSFHTHLLHGITGSGKTEVYLRTMQHVLAAGGGALFLVPEVALAPQTVGRLRARLEAQAGEEVVVWHSHLSDGERLDAWHALASGKARVCVGARSAVFAPVRDLRLIVVDEEHEASYKQDELPRYHGRDVAVYRASLLKGVCLLGSATPSLESFFNVQRGKYQVNRLSKRIDDRKLPFVHVIDMTREKYVRKGPVAISQFLADKMRDRLEKQEQTILFLNRRGYAPTYSCPDCEWHAQCEHCSITLTYHRTDETLRCHLCGYESGTPRACPECRSTQLRSQGFGTQRLEEAVKAILPKARVARIDADTMRKKSLFRKLFADFRTGKIDIMIGTQMIAKGLDFPNVTLVSLVGADLSMHIPDFRAAERTFQLLVQVAGRAGRGDIEGEVVVQSSQPHAAPIQYARQGDFDGFLDLELEQRREYRYPPFRGLIHHLFRGKNPEKIEFYAEQWVKQVEQAKLPDIEIRGPAPAPLEKMKDNYRYQIWYFTPQTSRTIAKLQELRANFQMDKDVIDVFDVDPVSLL